MGKRGRAPFEFDVDLYYELKKYGVKDQTIYETNGISVATFGKWKTRNGVKAPNLVSDELVIEIRRLYWEENIMQADICKQFNLSRGYVCDIVNGHKRKGVTT